MMVMFMSKSSPYSKILLYKLSPRLLRRTFSGVSMVCFVVGSWACLGMQEEVVLRRRVVVSVSRRAALYIEAQRTILLMVERRHAKIGRSTPPRYRRSSVAAFSNITLATEMVQEVVRALSFP